jgi:hypothetical protein
MMLCFMAKSLPGESLRQSFLFGSSTRTPSQNHAGQLLPRQSRCAIQASHYLFGGSKCLILRFAPPVFTFQAPVLRSNRKVPGGPCNCLGTHWNFQWPTAVSPPRACFGLKFSKNSLFLPWRPVSLDCIRHQSFQALSLNSLTPKNLVSALCPR